MRIKGRTSPRRRGGRVTPKMPEIEFNMKAIRAIKKRKNRVGRGHSKRSKKKGGV
jgi:hypothetical protein